MLELKFQRLWFLCLRQPPAPDPAAGAPVPAMDFNDYEHRLALLHLKRQSWEQARRQGGEVPQALMTMHNMINEAREVWTYILQVLRVPSTSLVVELASREPPGVPVWNPYEWSRWGFCRVSEEAAFNISAGEFHRKTQGIKRAQGHGRRRSSISKNVRERNGAKSGGSRSEKLRNWIVGVVTENDQPGPSNRRR